MWILDKLFKRPETTPAPAPAVPAAEIALVEAPPQTVEVDAAVPADKPTGRVKRHHMSYGRVEYFPHLAHKTARCVGMSYYLTDKERGRLQVSTVLAVPDPANPVDPNAIAIIRDDGRKLGYLSESQAAGYAPIIASLEAHQLDCRVEGSKLLLNLPSLPLLRNAASRLKGQPPTLE